MRAMLAFGIDVTVLPLRKDTEFSDTSTNSPRVRVPAWSVTNSVDPVRSWVIVSHDRADVCPLSTTGTISSVDTKLCTSESLTAGEPYDCRAREYLPNIESPSRSVCDADDGLHAQSGPPALMGQLTKSGAIHDMGMGALRYARNKQRYEQKLC